jgi:glutamate-ammonia-ligase adenylyltransferase
MLDSTVAETDTNQISGISFREVGVAAQNWERLTGAIAPETQRVLAQLLSESPDPDSALNLLERLRETASPEIFRLFGKHHFLLHYALAVFGYSEYLGDTLIQNPDLFYALMREGSLNRAWSRDDFAEAFARFRARSLDTEISLLLARFKRREYVRIMLRDVLRIATLAETTAEISALSDVLLEEALRDTDARLRNRYGPPHRVDSNGRLVVTPFTVLSLGKLGGNELNYSSDIDVLYLYGDGTEPPDAPISNREYFIRLAQQVTEVLSRMTAEGAPFRIDLRLRPQGGEGEPAVGLAHALDYYENKAAGWELQAMIKVRHSAGDQALAREFIRRVQPFVYTEELNFAAIETALETRRKISERRRRVVALTNARDIDVKVDRGGIRDIEFLVQCLQRVYGGTEQWLRSGGTLFSLQKLHDKEHISGKDFHELTTAYEFLRLVEHRLQMRHGQQTHRLPLDEHETTVLARMARAAAGNPEELIRITRKHMTAVAHIYGRIIHQQQAQQKSSEFSLHSVGPGREDTHRQLVDKLAIDAPELYKLVNRDDLEAHTRRNLNRFLAAAFTSSDRYAAIAQAPEAVEQALQIFRLSDFLTDILVRYPEQLDTLAKTAGLPPDQSCEGLFKSELPAQFASHPVLEYLAASDGPYSDKMAILRRHFRASVFASGVRDVMEARCVYQSLNETSAIADETISAAMSIAGAPPGFAVMALGRLGTCEHDLLSDADLLFLRDESVDSVAALRAAGRIVEVLSAYTSEGTVFPVDARLRPRGQEGELVVTPAQLGSYFEREAQTWEAITYTKLRAVAGEPSLAQQAFAATGRLFQRFGNDANFISSLREMRGKLEKTDTELDNLKAGPGGIYDIDFIVGALLVKRGDGETGTNLRERLLLLRDSCMLDEADWKRLDRHAELLRTAEHIIRLAVGRSRKTLPVAGPARDACDELCARILHRQFPEGLDITVRFALVGVREIYKRLMSN